MVMSYLRVNLEGASEIVREAMKEFVWIETEAGSDTIIVAATEHELVEKFKETELKAAELDAQLNYPVVMVKVDPATIINGKTVEERIHNALVAGWVKTPSGYKRREKMENGEPYEGGIWYIK
jgi:hypothetical protein